MLLIIISETVIANVENIESDLEYQSYIELVERTGRDQSINLIVSTQSEHMNKYGNTIDQYTSVTRIFGSNRGVIQLAEINVDKLFSDLINNKSSRWENINTKNEVTSLLKDDFLKEGGVIYKKQINALCTYPPTRAVIDSGIDYIFEYHDQENNYISEIIINKESCSKIAEQYSEYKLNVEESERLHIGNWIVSDEHEFVIYKTNGKTVHGHEFGFIKQKNSCGTDVLWLSWTTQSNDIQEFEGITPIFQIIASNETFNINPLYIATSNIITNLSSVSFTNFIASELLMEALISESSININISSPKEFHDEFDIKSDSFGLSNLIEAREVAYNLCSGMN
ncbi:hypothetical protein [Pseudidiomarina sp.]|uniref:hypothetical protein n=1 Tax=Pseudidiomarina sp. TaxID=2081707 RepID=UPI003A969253